MTWRHWLPTAGRLALRLRGVQAESVTWEGRDALKIGEARWDGGGWRAQAREVTALAPWAWRRALARGGTKEEPVFITVNGWRVARAGERNPEGGMTAGEGVEKVLAGLEALRTKIPRAVLLNGAVGSAQGDHRFGAVLWRDGVLEGDWSWPRLNDPADFKVKLEESGRAQVILRQTGLDLGARVTAERVAEGVRLKGFGRWRTNRAEFDVAFGEGGRMPVWGVVESAGFSAPARLLGLKLDEEIGARFRLAITNGQFELRLGAPGEVSEDGR